MAYLGQNRFGEEVYGDAAGGRRVEKNGKVLGSLSSPTGFDPFNLLSPNDRYKTVLEIVESVCREHDHDISGIGAAAAVREMVKYWHSHMAEGMEPISLIGDLQETKDRIDRIIGDLSTVLGLEEPRKTPAATA